MSGSLPSSGTPSEAFGPAVKHLDELLVKIAGRSTLAKHAIAKATSLLPRSLDPNHNAEQAAVEFDVAMLHLREASLMAREFARARVTYEAFADALYDDDDEVTAEELMNGDDAKGGA
jgi:hypothetical protein